MLVTVAYFKIVPDVYIQVSVINTNGGVTVLNCFGGYTHSTVMEELGNAEVNYS